MTQAHGDSGTTLIASCRLDGIVFAVSANHLLGAVRYVDALTPLPRRQGAVAGVIRYREHAIALLDLRLWLPWASSGEAASAPSGALALVLQLGSRHVAVQIDQIEGLTSVASSQIQRVHQQDNEEDVFHTVLSIPARAPEAEQKTIPLLDVAALMRLSAVWSESIAQIASVTAGTHAGTEHTEAVAKKIQMALVTIGEQKLAISIDAIRSVEPLPALKPLPGAPALLGYVHLHERDVPVMDAAALLQSDIGATTPLMVLLLHEDLWVGLPVTAIDALQAVDLAQLRPHEQAGYPASLLMTGVLSLPVHGAVLVPDIAAITSQYPLGTRRDAKLPTLLSANNKTSLQEQAYIVVEAGYTWALPMDVMAAVAFLDDSVEWLESSDTTCAAGLVGRIRYKQQTIALWDLQLLTGGSAQSSTARKVVIVSSADRLQALLVNELRQLLPAHSCDIVTLQSNKEGAIDLLRTKLIDAGKNYRILKLTDYSLS